MEMHQGKPSLAVPILHDPGGKISEFPGIDDLEAFDPERQP
jgi:hypothetical protein